MTAKIYPTIEIPAAHVETLGNMVSQLYPTTPLFFVIAQHVLDDTNYADYFRNQVANNALVIVDNGLFEYGKPLTATELLEASERLRAANRRPIPLAPDHLNSAQGTLEDSRKFQLLAAGKGYEYIGGIAQGKDLADVATCYQALYRLGFQPLCLSFLTPRVDFLKRYPLFWHRWHHMLGMYSLEEIKWMRWCVCLPYLVTLDTSKPVKAAVQDLELTNHVRGQGRWSIDMTLTKQQLKLCSRNFATLHETCTGPIRECCTPNLPDDYWKGSFHKEETL